MKTFQKYAAIVRRDWKNPPNLVTGIRMLGTLALPRLVTANSTKRRLAGLGLFVTLAATDKLDGWMAKKVFGRTELGAMLDPIVDKELILTTLFSLLADAKRRKDAAMVSALVAALSIISVREVSVALIKARDQRDSGQVKPAIQSGRVSMLLQSAAVGALLIPNEKPVVRTGKFALLAAAVGASLYSWHDYRQKYSKRATPS